MVIFGPRTPKFGILVTNYDTKHMFLEFLKNSQKWLFLNFGSIFSVFENSFNVTSFTNTAKVAKIWPKKLYIRFLHIFSQILNGHMTMFGQVCWFVILGQNARF